MDEVARASLYSKLVYLPTARTLVSQVIVQILFWGSPLERLTFITSLGMTALHDLFILFFFILVVIFCVVANVSHKFSTLRSDFDFVLLSVLVDFLRTNCALYLFLTLKVVLLFDTL